MEPLKFTLEKPVRGLHSFVKNPEETNEQFVERIRLLPYWLNLPDLYGKLDVVMAEEEFWKYCLAIRDLSYPLFNVWLYFENLTRTRKKRLSLPLASAFKETEEGFFNVTLEITNAHVFCNALNFYKKSA